jgi:hypothetical protein
MYEIRVPPGSSRLSVRINEPSDRQADLDLYLYDCTEKQCKMVPFSQGRFSSVGPTADETITVLDPKPGRWLALIDPVSVPSGTTSIKYSDVFLNPAMGEVTPLDEVSFHGTDQSWHERIRLRTRNPPTGERDLVGFAEVIETRESNGSAGADSGRDIPLGRTEFKFSKRVNNHSD